MIWFFLAAYSGIAATLHSALLKKTLLASSRSPFTVMLGIFIYALPVILLYWLSQGSPTTASKPGFFILIIGILILLEITGQYFYQKAITRLPLSVVTPFLETTVLFMVPFSLLFLGERISAAAFIALAVIVSGLAILRFEISQSGTFQKKDLIFAFAAAFVWAFTTVLQKKGVQLAGVPLFSLSYIGGIVGFLLAYHVIRKLPFRYLFGLTAAREIAPIGLIAGTSYVAQYIALSIAHPSVVIAIKNAMRSFNLIWDRSLFNERYGALRVVGNALTIGGAILLLLFK